MLSVTGTICRRVCVCVSQQSIVPLLPGLCDVILATTTTLTVGSVQYLSQDVAMLFYPLHSSAVQLPNARISPYISSLFHSFFFFTLPFLGCLTSYCKLTSTYLHYSMTLLSNLLMQD